MMQKAFRDAFQQKDRQEEEVSDFADVAKALQKPALSKAMDRFLRTQEEVQKLNPISPQPEGGTEKKVEHEGDQAVESTEVRWSEQEVSKAQTLPFLSDAGSKPTLKTNL